MKRRMYSDMRLKRRYDHIAPDGSEIRELSKVSGGSLCHCTLPPKHITRPVKHKTIEEIWYCVSGRGKVWRKPRSGKSQIVTLRPGQSLTVPRQTAFQFRNDDSAPLVFLIATIPPWPSDQEALAAPGFWDPVIRVGRTSPRREAPAGGRMRRRA